MVTEKQSHNLALISISVVGVFLIDWLTSNAAAYGDVPLTLVVLCWLPKVCGG